jgi:catechol 2,3-dioxygenase-like lactoylglutathione lyase family enzyme
VLEISQVLLPVDDIERSLGFYETVLGLPVALRDGDRYAALRAGGVKIALAAPAERLPEQGAAAAFKVASLDDVAERLRAGGIEVPEVLEGEHERTIELRDPDGHAVLFYEPKR